MKIGIFGGTYNPPHLGHMAAAKAAIETLHLDKLLLIPDRIPPHKELPENPVSNEDRLAMTRIMGDRLDCPDVVEVSDLEMHRTGKSYTADTLRQLRQVYPTDELWLMMGTDMFLTLHSWYQPEEILKRSGILTFGRNRTTPSNCSTGRPPFWKPPTAPAFRCRSSTCPVWWRCPPPSCARRWQTGAGRSTWTRPSTATSCAKGCTALTPI